MWWKYLCAQDPTHTQNSIFSSSGQGSSRYTIKSMRKHGYSISEKSYLFTFFSEAKWRNKHCLLAFDVVHPPSMEFSFIGWGLFFCSSTFNSICAKTRLHRIRKFFLILSFYEDKWEIKHWLFFFGNDESTFSLPPPQMDFSFIGRGCHFLFFNTYD
jgi:hypothetical protein